MRRPGDGSKVWGAILGRVLKRPAVSVLAAVGFLLVLATPVIGIHTEQLSLDKLLPANASIMQSYHRITAAFPGGPTPARVVVKAPDVTSGDVTAAVADFQTRAAATGLVGDPILVDGAPRRERRRDLGALGRQRVRLDLGPRPARVALRRRTRDVRPAARRTRLTSAASSRSRRTSTPSSQHVFLPVILFVLVLAFLLMLVAFRSVTIAAVSVAAERAVDVGGLRRDGRGLPARLGRGPRGRRRCRCHRVVDPAVRLRDPLRPVDGLPRVRGVPDPRGARPWPVHPGRRRPRDQDLGRCRHQRGRRSWSRSSRSSRRCR